MTSFKTYNALTGEYTWIEAETAAQAVIKTEAARSGTPEKALKAGHDDRSEIDVWCGETSILGTKTSVMK